MAARLLALLVHDHSKVLDSLKFKLSELAVETYTVRTLAEAKRQLLQTQASLIFTDTSLPDGSWIDVVNLAAKAGTPANVIVVGRAQDIHLYISAIEKGAFDFVLPPFEHDALAYVVHAAAEDAGRRRREVMRAAAA